MTRTDLMTAAAALVFLMLQAGESLLVHEPDGDRARRDAAAPEPGGTRSAALERLAAPATCRSAE